MHEVEAGAIGDALPQGVVPGLAHLVPTHVRHLQALAIGAHQRIAEIADLAGNHVQAVHAAVFLGVGHQGLHAHADSQHRLVLLHQRIRQ